MRHLFREVPEACDNTLWIAERADVDDRVRQAAAARVPAARGLRRRRRRTCAHLTFEGARQRWGDPLPDAVVERLAYELQVIADMGFSSYFLIVWDLIQHARDNGIRVGPGRGSAAGCAVAYCLRITDLDPIQYDLLFERFLNPSRISMPDIDMDFDSRYRDEMIRYAAERYGRDHVAQIVTFSTIKARAAVRDAARVLGYPYAVGDKVAKAMPPLVMGRDTPLYACLERAPEVRRRLQDGRPTCGRCTTTDPDAKQGHRRGQGPRGPAPPGRHPRRRGGDHQGAAHRLPARSSASPRPARTPRTRPIVTQYEMHGVEELGLLKMDFLGLRNLDVITDTVELIRATTGIDARHRRRPPRRRRRRYELLRRGDSHRRVPARGRRPCARSCARWPRPLRRRRRPRRPVPAGADGGQHAQRLRRPQERPQAGRRTSTPTPRSSWPTPTA